MANPDGTTQVSPPTRSAFAPQKSDPPPAATAPEDKGTAKHEQSIIDGLKGLISNHKPIQEGGTDVNSAVDEAVKGVPGNTANY